MTELSPRRATILAFIRDRVTARGQPPSLAEIAEACGFASRSAARKQVQALASAGLIVTTPNQARGIQLPERRSAVEWLEIPIWGRVAAGAPIGPDADMHGLVRLDRTLFARAPDYLLRVQGDSMIDEGILDGDLVGVARAAEAHHGQIVVARLDGEVTIKRFEHRRGAIRLMPRNPSYVPIAVRPDQDFAIEGLYCGLVRPGP